MTQNELAGRHPELLTVDCGCVDGLIATYTPSGSMGGYRICPNCNRTGRRLKTLEELLETLYARYPGQPVEVILGGIDFPGRKVRKASIYGGPRIEGPTTTWHVFAEMLVEIVKMEASGR